MSRNIQLSFANASYLSGRSWGLLVVADSILCTANRK